MKKLILHLPGNLLLWLRCNERGVPSATVDGDVSRAGAGALLELTFQPTSVNFKEIYIMERDKGTKPTPVPSLATVPIRQTPSR